jgi:pimeloyl-ACP methyl ester carboxylesterase
MSDSVRQPASQPVVLMGGFASNDLIYGGLRDTLAEIAGQRVWVVKTRSVDWLPSVVPAGWLYLLNKLAHTVRQAVQGSRTGKVTLVGHSAGGVLARLYLSPRPFLGHTYSGLEVVDRLITLGSPHDNQHPVHGGWMSRWIERRYPGAYFSEQVRYASVAGRLIRGKRDGSLHERNAYRFYRRMAGQGDIWGDGLIPVRSALLDGAQQIVLDGVSHFAGFGGPWYGAQDVVPRWWHDATG